MDYRFFSMIDIEFTFSHCTLQCEIHIMAINFQNRAKLTCKYASIYLIMYILTPIVVRKDLSHIKLYDFYIEYSYMLFVYE